MSEPAKPFQPQRVPPPTPAPYLVGIPHLSDEYLTSERKELEPHKQPGAKRMQRQLMERIFFARRAYEEQHGVQIVSEPPLAP